MDGNKEYYCMLYLVHVLFVKGKFAFSYYISVLYMFLISENKIFVVRKRFNQKIEKVPISFELQIWSIWTHVFSSVHLVVTFETLTLKLTFDCERTHVEVLILFFVSSLSILHTYMKLKIWYKNTFYILFLCVLFCLNRLAMCMNDICLSILFDISCKYETVIFLTRKYKHKYLSLHRIYRQISLNTKKWILSEYPLQIKINVNQTHIKLLTITHKTH